MGVCVYSTILNTNFNFSIFSLILDNSLALFTLFGKPLSPATGLASVKGANSRIFRFSDF